MEALFLICRSARWHKAMHALPKSAACGVVGFASSGIGWKTLQAQKLTCKELLMKMGAARAEAGLCWGALEVSLPEPPARRNSARKSESCEGAGEPFVSGPTRRAGIRSGATAGTDSTAAVCIPNASLQFLVLPLQARRLLGEFGDAWRSALSLSIAKISSRLESRIKRFFRP